MKNFGTLFFRYKPGLSKVKKLNFQLKKGLLKGRDLVKGTRKLCDQKHYYARGLVSGWGL